MEKKPMVVAEFIELTPEIKANVQELVSLLRADGVKHPSDVERCISGLSLFLN